MIKKLRLKFVCVIMVLAALLLGVILGVVLHFSATTMEMQSLNLLRSIASAPFQKGLWEQKPPDSGLSFFVVRTGAHGEVIGLEGNHTDPLPLDVLEEISSDALASRQESGLLKSHGLRYFVKQTPMGFTIVFSDTSTENAAMEELTQTCLLIFLVAMVLFLLISLQLSRWAVRPVEKAWDQQRQFVADASHELKTPLSVIMANAELLQSDETPEQESKQFSQNILTMSYQMRSLVENMLEMARIDNGTAKIPDESVDFSQLVQDAVLSFQLLFEEKNMSLSASVAEDLQVTGSEQLLFQVLDVLLDNALKYSVPEATVTLQLTRTGRTCILSVQNPGAPISREDLNNIFKRFYRVDKARPLSGSYGLGLPIAQSIVEAHKGKIWARSENGCNSFFVQLPARPQ